MRAAKTVTGGSTEGYVWNIAEAMPTIIQDGSTRYITGPSGLPIEQVDGSGTVEYCIQDQLGSTRGLLDSAGTVVGSYTFTPYGELKGHSGASTPFGYAGQYTDSESGLQYLRARYYDPSTAQFLTVDPLVGSTMEPYGYAGGNPANWADPTGLLCGAPNNLWPAGIKKQIDACVNRAENAVSSALHAVPEGALHFVADPDYMRASVTVPFGYGYGSISVVRSRAGKTYWSLGVGTGIPPAPWDALPNLTLDWGRIHTRAGWCATDAETDNFISGWGAGASGYVVPSPVGVVGGGVEAGDTRHLFDPNNMAVTYGLSTEPGGGIGADYTWPLPWDGSLPTFPEFGP